MAFFRGAKRPVEILCKRMSGPLNSGHGYSTMRGGSIAEIRGSESSSCTSNYANARCDIRMFVRGYTVEVPPSEQMSLIKKLRERTSAPIKDVKSSLVECNWDIGK